MISSGLNINTHRCTHITQITLHQTIRNLWLRILQALFPSTQVFPILQKLSIYIYIYILVLIPPFPDMDSGVCNIQGPFLHECLWYIIYVGEGIYGICEI